ncbi:hypothetical protein Csa_007329 [Cucumis sativus]|uniref:Uncharacterized protein n=1 Tax=Cucumis sativus TaxID=3659 RepID=A0ACB6HC69_CUCSA|nr:hypothetical protein CSA_016964 [Cucumis sativus]KAE8653627.1 hypothetical protein Csa_007329 [Cucumis sativus]
MENSSKSPDDRKSRFYHPYQDLHVPITKLYELPTAPEHLFFEEAARPHRSWGENLQYYTGIGYLSGALFGGARGSIQGLRAAEPAGLGTGAVYKAASGPRSAAIAGAIGGIAAAAAVAGKQAVKRYVPI